MACAGGDSSKPSSGPAAADRPFIGSGLVSCGRRPQALAIFCANVIHIAAVRVAEGPLF